jgi:hypothetical protein
MIQGARYIRQGGQHFNPHTYGEIDTIADHFHYAGNKGPHAANGRSDSAGGGHAHAGLLVYQGNSWPAEYHGKVFMNNIHGQRLNMERLERSGSGYIARHAPDFLFFNDTWSQILNLLSDQDGSVYAIDWYDANQCHHGREEGHDRSNGRIFKVVYGNTPSTKVDLQKKSNTELVDLQLHPNEWMVRHARRILQERGPNPQVSARLIQWLGFNGSETARPTPTPGYLPASDETRQLRLLWTLHTVGGLTPEIGMQCLDRPQEYVRAWALQLMLESKQPTEALLQKMALLAQKDPSPVVRLYLAAGLQRVPVAQRAPILSGLLARAEDAKDHNLPFMYWYAAEPVVGLGADQGIRMLQETRIPKVREFIARRMVANTKGVAAR